MLNIVIFGAPGSGKGTQSEFIIEKYGLIHISTGEVLRGERDAGSDLGKLAESYMSRGHLIPDNMMIDSLGQVFDQTVKEKDCKGIIFDGYPRTIPQGVALDEMLEERGEKLTAVISLEVAEEELVKRMVKRGIERGRTDDNQETILNRLRVYYEQTTPLKEYYEKQGKLHKIEGIGTKEQIFEHISAIIDKLK